jgi:hypothetical protein
MSIPGAEQQASQERPGPVAWVLLQLVRAYQLFVSPLMGPRCRFYPSCSAYAVTALRRHGAIKGTGLAAWRLLRCNPWNPGGIDHVPAKGGSAAAECSHHTDGHQTAA